MRTLINDKWKFGEFVPGTTPETILNSISLLQPLDIPHDWMISDVNNLYRSSVGAYFRTLDLDITKHNSVFFEGVYMRTTVFLNGKEIFFWPYGYTSFEVDLTPYQKDGENELLVYVDYRCPNTRWYSGAGIFRDVWFLSKEPVHIPEGGVYVHAEEFSNSAAATKTTIGSQNVEVTEDQSATENVTSTATTETTLHMKAVETAPAPDSPASSTAPAGSAGYRITIDTEVVVPYLLSGIEICHILKDTMGKTVAESSTTLNPSVPNEPVTYGIPTKKTDSDFSGSEKIVNTQILQLNRAIRWDIENPYLYTLETTVLSGGIVQDSYTQKIGLRTIHFSPDEGFFLNGRHVKLNGACMHHDLGALGAAFNKKAARRQLEKLQALGINAVRTSHNPPAVGLMELADEMGILINSDAFDMWEQPKTENDYGIFFHEWCERDVESWIRRDRNHPSVIMWSCGNEIPDTNNLSAVAIAERLEKAIRKNDPRHNAYTTIASNFVAWENAQKSQDVFELSGYNYLESVYDEHHVKFPHWCIYGSETASTVQSRGIYHFPKSNRLLTYEDQQCSSLDNCSTNWGAKSVHRFITDDRDRPFSAGQFIWTGWDYIGEPTPYFSKNSFFGHIDTAGFYKDTAYIIKAAWMSCEKDPFVHISPYWDFNEGQMIDVDVYSNAPKVALYFKKAISEDNGTLIGEKNLDQAHDTDFSAHFRLPYRPGVLRALAYDKDGNVIAEDTTGSFDNPVSICLSAEYPSIKADGEDLQFIQISVLDAEGREVRNARNRVEVSVFGPARLMGLDNGDSTDYDEYKTSSRKLFSGKLLAILAATKESGEVTVQVTSPGLTPATLTFPAVPAKGRKGISCSYSVPSINPVSTRDSKIKSSSPVNLQEVPIRKLTLTCTPTSLVGKALTPEQPTAEITATIEPPNATYNDVHFKAVTLDGIESRAVTIEVLEPENIPSDLIEPEKLPPDPSKPDNFSPDSDGPENNLPDSAGNLFDNRISRCLRARITAVSDGEFRLVASASNGKDHPEILSDLEFSVSGFGSATLDPYTMVHGCEYAESKKEALLSFRGSVNFGDGNVIRFDNVDFGDYGSDELHLSLFSFRNEEAVEIWDGEPEDSELLFSGIYAVSSEYNVLQEDTFQLKKRLQGIRSLTFRFEHGFVLGGFRMTKKEKAYGLLSATEHGMITGDTYEEKEDGIYRIGNNVDIEFPGMNFTEGVSYITITGRGRTENPIHIRFFTGDTVIKQVVEFPVSEEIQTHTFPIEGFSGEGKVNFIFLPGSDFDLLSFQFS